MQDGTRSASMARRRGVPGPIRWSWPTISSRVSGRIRAARGAARRRSSSAAAWNRSKASHNLTLPAARGRQQANSQLLQLLRGDIRRRTGHEIHSALRLRERNAVANRIEPCHHHDDAIQPERDTSVGRRAVRQGFDEEAELLVGFFRSEAECLEHAFLHVGPVNADAAATEFYTVDDQVVRQRFYGAGIRLQ